MHQTSYLLTLELNGSENLNKICMIVDFLHIFEVSLQENRMVRQCLRIKIQIVFEKIDSDPF